MCRRTAAPPLRRQPSLRVLYSLESFSALEDKTRPPDLPALLLTGLLFLLVLVASEQLCRHLLARLQDLHEILAVETHRQIIARHIGVDALACVVVFYLGWTSRHLHAGLFRRHAAGKKEATPTGDRAAAAAANATARLFTYQPGGFRVALLFFVYQLKNMYDSYVWADGPEYLFHHAFSLVTAYGCMAQTMGHYYALFFFGMCELSTAVVCLLANFDAHQGVPGLGEALPLTKVGVGVVFVALFLLCRCLLWPLYSYHFCRDVLSALRRRTDGQKPLSAAQRRWMLFFLVSLSGLSVLQVAWLGQIYVIARQEFAKMGWIAAA